MELPHPFVSVCTPTFNRRPFIPILLEIFRHQDWPRDAIEWIIVDDGTDKIDDILQGPLATDLKPVIRYFSLDSKMNLGAKRNFMHDQVRGDFIVYMDDDDYYPPCRIRHAIDTLKKYPEALCAGSSIIHVYFHHIQRIIEFGPYGPYHATAGTFAFRRELLSLSRYQDHACLAEEKHFLKNYTIPLVQLDPLKTILVFSHRHNTFDKKKLLCRGIQGPFVHETTKQVGDFLEEEPIRSFFIDRLDRELIQYSAGEPAMKPDVLQQTQEIQQARHRAPQPQKPQILSCIDNRPTLQETFQIIRNHENMILQLQNIIQQDRQWIQQQSDYIEYITTELKNQGIEWKEPPQRGKSLSTCPLSSK